jgi:initiation factor 1A
MVRNSTGGSGTKGLARKHQVKDSGGKLRISECELECYACITKMLGNGMCEIRTNNDMRLIAHIRNKFSGRQKRHNMITVFSIVLIGLREWEKPSKNCDIMVIYDDNQIEQLRNIPNIKIDHILQIRTSNIYNDVKSSDIVDFIDEADEDEEIPQNNLKINSSSKNAFVSKAEEMVDIDDI